ncbi:hypothetical protein [Streptomyces mirabilis]|nr:hypothetical protein [Streptomyces mirabilis]
MAGVSHVLRRLLAEFGLNPALSGWTRLAERTPGVLVRAGESPW